MEYVWVIIELDGEDSVLEVHDDKLEMYLSLEELKRDYPTDRFTYYEDYIEC